MSEVPLSGILDGPASALCLRLGFVEMISSLRLNTFNSQLCQHCGRGVDDVNEWRHSWTKSAERASTSAPSSVTFGLVVLWWPHKKDTQRTQDHQRVYCRVGICSTVFGVKAQGTASKGVCLASVSVCLFTLIRQGYLAHKKPPHSRTLCLGPYGGPSGGGGFL